MNHSVLAHEKHAFSYNIIYLIFCLVADNISVDLSSETEGYEGNYSKG